MKSVILGILLTGMMASAFAGRSSATTIVALIVKETYVEIYTEALGGCGTKSNRWHLLITHKNFDAMFSGLLASKLNNKKVDIVGNGICGIGENISWAYIDK
jgi:hypothetical protein